MATSKYLFFILFTSVVCNTTFAQQKKLVWSDEFNYTGLPDSTKWSYDIGGHGWGNNEAQYYTTKNKNNARVANGKLIIEARKEKKDSNAYTSARLITRGKTSWQYGFIEVRAKLPKGRGTWPAIWLLADTKPLQWPDDGEIDIMEHVGFDPGKIYATIHCKKYNHTIGTQQSGIKNLRSYNSAFHVYQLHWNKDSISMAIDGQKYFTFFNDHTGYDAWPFDNAMYLLLNIAVGGNWGGKKGINTNIFPQRLEIDYVRVWQLQ
jgi:beta-glucanase (GH16 family)